MSSGRIVNASTLTLNPCTPTMSASRQQHPLKTNANMLKRTEIRKITKRRDKKNKGKEGRADEQKRKGKEERPTYTDSAS